MHMAANGLDKVFDVVVCVGELPPGRGKPQPDVYIEAARRINVDPAKCRAYEVHPSHKYFLTCA